MHAKQQLHSRLQLLIHPSLMAIAFLWALGALPGPMCAEIQPANEASESQSVSPPDSQSNEWLSMKNENGQRFGLNFLATGISFHPDGGENEGYPRQLDDQAYWVLQLGGQVDGDLYLNRYLLLRSTVSLFRDCADVWAGYFHLGPRLNLPIGEKFVFRFGIGPTLIWRENWLGVVKGYKSDSFYGPATTGTFQSAFIWYGGNLDFEYKLRPKLSLLYSMIPGWPEVITSSVGVRITL